MIKRLRNKILRLIFPFVPNGIRITILRLTGSKVGKDVIITPHTKISCRLGLEHHLTIEDRAAIGADHLILTSDPGKSILLKNKIEHPFVDVIGSIVIKKDAWLGTGSIILPNVTIGERAIVGAGAVVTKDVPPDTVVAGVPARVIRKLK